MKKLLISLVIVFALTSPVSASLIFDTGQSANSSSGWLLNSNQWLAAEFTVNNSYTLTDIQGFMFINSGGDFNISLYGSSVNGDRMFSAIVDAQPSYTDWLGLSDLDWEVSPGTYWVAFETTNTGFEAGMPWGAPNSSGNETYTWNGKYWNPEDWDYDRLNLGIRVWGDAILANVQSAPEPATMFLLGSGLLSLGIIGRRRLK